MASVSVKARERRRDVIEQRHVALDIGRDDSVADADQSASQKFALRMDLRGSVSVARR